MTQLEAVLLVMGDGLWHTITNVHQRAVSVGDPTWSRQAITTRMRDLRKPECGGHTVERKSTNAAGVARDAPEDHYAYRLILRAADVPLPQRQTASKEEHRMEPEETQETKETAIRARLAAWKNPPNGVSVKLSARTRRGSIRHVAAMFDHAAGDIEHLLKQLDDARANLEHANLIAHRVEAAERKVGQLTTANTALRAAGDSKAAAQPPRLLAGARVGLGFDLAPFSAGATEGAAGANAVRDFLMRALGVHPLDLIGIYELPGRQGLYLEHSPQKA